MAAPELPAAILEQEQSQLQQPIAAQPSSSQQQFTVTIPPAGSVQPISSLHRRSQSPSHGTNLPLPLPLVSNGPSRLLEAASALQRAQPEQHFLPAFNWSAAHPLPGSTQLAIAASQGNFAQPAATAAQPRPHQSVGGATSSTLQANTFRPPLPKPASLGLGVHGKLTKRMASILKNFPANKKRTRAKKPKDAPKRPKSAYMFFLGEFREEYKKSHPEVIKVAAMAEACGAAWRALSPERRAVYDALSAESKAEYAKLIEEYEKEHPKPLRGPKQRDPDEIRRPQSAYFCFLADFREKYKMKHVGEAIQVKVIGAEAGKAWKQLSDEEKQPWEAQSRAMKEEFKSRTAEAEAVAAQQALAAEILADSIQHQVTWPDEDMPDNMQSDDDDQDQEWFEDAGAAEEVEEDGRMSEELQHIAQPPSQEQRGPPSIEELQSHAPAQLLTTESLTSTPHLKGSSVAIALDAAISGHAAYQFREHEHTRHLSPISGPRPANGDGACDPVMAHGSLGGCSAQAVSSYCDDPAHLPQGGIPLPASSTLARLDTTTLATMASQAGEHTHVGMESVSALPAQQLGPQHPAYSLASSMTALPPIGTRGGYPGDVPLLGVSRQPMPLTHALTQPGSANSLACSNFSAQSAIPRGFPSFLSHGRDRGFISSPFGSSDPVVTLPGGVGNEHHGRTGNIQLPTLPSLPSLGGLPSLPLGGWSQSEQDQ